LKENAMEAKRALARACAAGVLGLASLPAWGQTLPATAPDGRWRTVISQLSSESFAERNAGRQALARATYADRSSLAAIAEKSNDAELKAQVLACIDALDDQHAVEPDRFTVHIDNVPLEAAFAELSRQTGLPFYEEQQQGGRLPPQKRTVSLDIHDATFWETLDLASLQTRTTVTSLFDGSITWEGIGGSRISSRVHYDPAVATSLLHVHRNHSVLFDAGPGGDPGPHSQGRGQVGSGPPPGKLPPP
jgi:hypothetical protein